MPIVVNLKALGLNTQANALEAPEGSMIEASNVIIRRDNVIEPARGFKFYSNQFGSSSDRSKQLTQYRDRILHHYADKLQFDDGNGNLLTFSGSYSEPQAGLRMKFVQSNGNLYFTTSDGVQKISAKTASDFNTNSGYITPAGAEKALDITGKVKITLGEATGFLPTDSAVAYRQVWGYKDANDNLVLGSPSSRTEVYNPLQSINVRDFMNILGALDSISASMINDANYVNTLKLDLTSDAAAIRTQIIALAEKIDQDIRYASTTGAPEPLTISTASVSAGECTINFSSGDPTQYFQVNSKINLRGLSNNGFVPTSGTINGNYVLTDVTATSISFATTAGNGSVTVNADSIIESYEYRYIVNNPTWAVPSTPVTNDDNKDAQSRLEQMITRLQVEPTTVISNLLSTTYIQPLAITTSSTVTLRITIPENLPTNYFYQIYRSSISEATGVASLSDLTPSDELQLVYEAFPTTAELSAGEIIIEDVTPDAFRGANLYTNASTGEGITQANDTPPYAKDINRFKNYVFYANTKTKHRKLMNLLGVSKLIEDYNNSIIPKLTISDGTNHDTYTFVTGQYEITDVTLVAEASFTGTTRRYFDLYSANDETAYRVVYESPTMTTDPSLTGKTAIRVVLAGGETANQVAEKTRDAIALVVQDFLTANNTLPTIRITNTNYGACTDAAIGTLPGGSSVTVFQQGRGENKANKEVLLSINVSPSIAVEETAKSLVKVINSNANSSVYAFYLSGPTDVPGKMLFEAKNLQTGTFYCLTNNENTGSSFNPDLSPLTTPTITAISTGFPAVITTSAAHNLVNGNSIVICSTNSTPIADGVYPITRINSTQFSIPVNVTVAGTTGVYENVVDAEFSDNEVKPNRIYYSKFQQPEAVPIVNYFDVGNQDSEIQRIFPLRDSLFVFKKEGLYRISGNIAPFDLTLFDSSVNILAPDSVSVTDNQVYAWCNSGINRINEAGVDIVSRPFNDQTVIIQQYTNFNTATWGLGYESDDSYTVFTVENNDDTIATKGYRYSSTTNTWTTLPRTATCGIIFGADDKMYVGAGDANRLEQERKSFSRYDYANREIETQLSINKYLGTNITLNSVSGIEAGDVLVQTQRLTVYEYNMLLKKLDIDPGVNGTDYYSTLQAVGGDDLRAKLVALAQKLDADTGVTYTDYFSRIDNKSGSIVSNSIANPTVITTSGSHGILDGRYVQISGVAGSNPDINDDYVATYVSATEFSIPENVITGGTGGLYQTQINSFEDLEACYNLIVEHLNNDPTVSFTNYKIIDTTTTQESVIISVNKNTKVITLNLELEYIVGPMTVFKSVPMSFTYAPVVAGDPVSLKHYREATVMFENRAFTNAKLSFSTDLLPQFIPVQFNGDGNGIFGMSQFGTGYFGGSSNSAPFRTYVPRQCQRCRFINLKFEHKVARESIKIYGISLLGEMQQSSRAYR